MIDFRNAIGKPTEIALLRYMDAFVGDIESFKERYEKLLELSFSWFNKCSLKVFALNNDQLLITIKGEPEAIIYKSSHILTVEGLKSFSQTNKAHLVSLCDKLGRERLRIIGLYNTNLFEILLTCLFLVAIAQVIMVNNKKYYKRNGQLDSNKFSRILENNEMKLQFLGLITLQNPVRLAVPEAIFKCRSAGIKVIMITADHPETGLSVAETAGIVLKKRTINLNIESDNDDELTKLETIPNVYTGSDLARLTDSQLIKIIHSMNDLVFARISEMDKLRIVNCCRQNKSIVAVTGLASTDIPIFDRSHVRISLKCGTDITKRNSDIILLDDNFASIIKNR